MSRMLPDNDFHFRLGHAAPAPVSLPAESLHDVRPVLRNGDTEASASSGPRNARRFAKNLRIGCEWLTHTVLRRDTLLKTSEHRWKK
jgi:hypothetical protein